MLIASRTAAVYISMRKIRYLEIVYLCFTSAIGRPPTHWICGLHPNRPRLPAFASIIGSSDGEEGRCEAERGWCKHH